MMLSDFYESTILRVEASFGFSAFECAPEAITSAIGLQPDETRLKGERRPVLGGRRTFVVPFSSWHITSGSPSKDVNVHLRQLLARLEPARRPFDPAWGTPSFGVTWKGSYLYAGSGPFYEADVIAGVAFLGAALHQDIYQVDDEDENAAEE